MKVKTFLSITDLTSSEIEHLVDRAIELKTGDESKVLAKRSVVLLFEKPSLRTRASFDVGIHQLGGYCLYVSGQEVGLGEREPTADVAKVLSRYVDCIVARVNTHASLKELAQYASVPVINALSDWEHPCQALADLQTIKETKGTLKGLTLAFVGDGNNTARSLALAVSSVGVNFTIASPKGYELDSATLVQARQRASEWGGVIKTTDDIYKAVSGADAVYTDVWVSMGNEMERRTRLKAFRGYTVDSTLMSFAKADAIFMHDMPAHYGEEVVAGMLDHPQSVAFDQAENRLHAQKALLEYLLESKESKESNVS